MDLVCLAQQYAKQGKSLKHMAASECIPYSKLKKLLGSSGYSHPTGVSLSENRILYESGMNLNAFIRYQLNQGLSRNQIAKLSGLDNKTIQAFADKSGIYIPKSLPIPLTFGNIKQANRDRDQSKRKDLILISYMGKDQSLADWCRELGLSRSTVKRRLDLGFTTHEAFLKQIRFRRGFSTLNSLSRINTDMTGTQMNQQMVDPHISMVSFQECILANSFKIAPVSHYDNLYSYADMPEPGERRLTYVRLDKDYKTVKAFLSCVPNGQVDGHICVSVGYAVPEQYRNMGYAKSILRDVVKDLRLQAKNNGAKGLAVEAVIDESNLASRKVAEAVLKVKPDRIIDSLSQRPAVRYTAKFNITD